MIWIRKTFPFGAQWAADQDRFSEIQLRVAADSTDAYTRMLMVSQDAGDGTDVIYMLLPRQYASAFEGYDQLERGPREADSLLVGNQTHFWHLFRSGQDDEGER